MSQAAAYRRYERYAWGVLAWNVGVVVWGAFVRASGSGAGCGNHWPVCNGQVIPQSPSVHTLIELTHRLMTGVDTPLVIALAWFGWRLFATGSPVRKAAAASLFFLVTEALVGAALVKLDLVADNRSTARIWMMSLHLVNTFMLLGSLALTAWLAPGRRPARLRGQGALAGMMLGAVIATIVVGTTGAITALGDTLYPKTHVGLDVSTAATFLERLRIVHPFVAIATALYVVVAGILARRLRPGAETARLSRLLAALFAVQVAAGTINVVLLAPVWMQLVHLVLADAVWIALVCTAASALAAPATEAAASPVRTPLAVAG
ncbi:MAG: COX15/CtaA family protein [Gemmatimonadetes bacterium]|nr:COX15/CtaA family protein [Gemmatimonadota bacterium]